MGVLVPYATTEQLTRESSKEQRIFGNVRHMYTTLKKIISGCVGARTSRWSVSARLMSEFAVDGGGHRPHHDILDLPFLPSGSFGSISSHLQPNRNSASSRLCGRHVVGRINSYLVFTQVSKRISFPRASYATSESIFGAYSHWISPSASFHAKIPARASLSWSGMKKADFNRRDAMCMRSLSLD